MVGALFYWFCFMIIVEQLKIERKEQVMSQLDMTMRFHDCAVIREDEFKIRPKVWCFVIGFIPVVRILVGMIYLAAVARGSRTKDWFLTKT